MTGSWRLPRRSCNLPGRADTGPADVGPHAAPHEKGLDGKARNPSSPAIRSVGIGALLPQARYPCQSTDQMWSCHSAAMLPSSAVNCASSVESAMAVVADCPPFTATDMASNQPAPTSRWWRVAV